MLRVLDTLQSLSLLTMVEVVGPIVLAAGLAYGIFNSRWRRSQQPSRTAGTVYSQDQ